MKKIAGSVKRRLVAGQAAVEYTLVVALFAVPVSYWFFSKLLLDVDGVPNNGTRPERSGYLAARIRRADRAGAHPARKTGAHRSAQDRQEEGAAYSFDREAS